ncbi:hypothetical protein Tco_0431202 [Tanacetum coccineum]|uniref:Uncharacterized protein n=1 Tax=Tanacetum coccineum TaxID=301880 RepID=A0ABQ5BG30_9ASTR
MAELPTLMKIREESKIDPTQRISCNVVFLMYILVPLDARHSICLLYVCTYTWLSLLKSTLLLKSGIFRYLKGNHIHMGLSQFLYIVLLAGHSKKQKSTANLHYEKLNTLPYQDVVLKSSGCALNYVTMDLRSTKFRCIVTIKVQSLYAVIVFNTSAFQHIDIRQHFNQRQVERKVVELYFVEIQITNWLTYLRRHYERSASQLYLPLP